MILIVHKTDGNQHTNTQMVGKRARRSRAHLRGVSNGAQKPPPSPPPLFSLSALCVYIFALLFILFFPLSLSLLPFRVSS